MNPYTVVISITIVAVIAIVIVPAFFDIDYNDVTYFFYAKLRDKINNSKSQKNFYKRIHWLKKILRSRCCRDWLIVEAKEYYRRRNVHKHERPGVPFTSSPDYPYAKGAGVWSLTAYAHLFTTKEQKIIRDCCKTIKKDVPDWREFYTPVAADLPTEQEK